LRLSWSAAVLKLWLPALTAEASALLLLARGAAARETLIAFFALHAVASALIALALALLFPRPYRRPRRWVWASLFGLNFFVPVIGLVASFIGVVAGALFPQLLKPAVFRRVAAPDYTATRDYDLTRLRGAAVRARLREQSAPAAARAEALLAIGATAAPASAAALREMLTDPVDDVRLLAYGLLDRREKSISEQLVRERSVLAAAQEIGDRDAARTVHHRIGQLYWELVYQGLVQGDMQRYALEQALIHTEQALDGSAADGARWLLIGRIRLKRGELRPAQAAFDAALEHGLSSRNVAPYLAELRFLQRRYADVRRLMYGIGAQPASEQLAALQQFWAA
jgi:tetratricopeptide (TPR) repeat protein